MKFALNKLKYLILTLLLNPSTGICQDSNNPQKFESIMLDQEELKKVNQALEMFRQGKEFVITKTQEALSEEDREKMEIDQLSKEMELINKESKIHLGSILFFSKKTWSIWVNGKKITSDSNYPKNSIYVAKASERKIDFMWKLSISKWRVLTSNLDSKVTPQINNSGEVNVKFSLYSNQTFLLRENKTVEGDARTTKPQQQNANNDQ